MSNLSTIFKENLIPLDRECMIIINQISIMMILGKKYK